METTLIVLCILIIFVLINILAVSFKVDTLIKQPNTQKSNISKSGHAGNKFILIE